MFVSVLQHLQYREEFWVSDSFQKDINSIEARGEVFWLS